MGTSRFRAKPLVAVFALGFLLLVFFSLAWGQGDQNGDSAASTGPHSGGPWVLVQVCCSGVCGLLSFFFGSFWGLLIVAYFAFPWVRDKLWGWRRSRSFLSSQHSALINPVDADARFQLGNIYLKGRNYRKAVQYLQECLAIFEQYPNVPKDSHVYAALGHALRQMKRYDEALKIYQEGLTLDPKLDYGDVHLGISNCFRLKGDRAQAREWFQKTLKTNESLAEAAYRLAVLGDKGGNREEKEKYLAECLDIVHTSPSYIKKKNRSWGWRSRFFPLTKGWKR
jgi:tetratricopeptide (TPR) repeat protein